MLNFGVTFGCVWALYSAVLIVSLLFNMPNDCKLLCIFKSKMKCTEKGMMLRLCCVGMGC